MELRDRRIEVAGEVRDARSVVGAGRDHDLLRLVVPVLCSDPEAVAVLRRAHAGDADAGPDGEPHARGVCLEVVGNLVLAGKRVRISRKRHARQVVEAAGREEPQPFPAGSPHITDPRSGIQDDEIASQLRQVVPHRQSGLSAADDHRLEPISLLHVRPPLELHSQGR